MNDEESYHLRNEEIEEKLLFAKKYAGVEYRIQNFICVYGLEIGRKAIEQIINNYVGEDENESH